MPIPTIRLAWLAALGLPLTLLGLFGRTGLAVAALYDLTLAAAALADRLATGDPRRLEVLRSAPSRWVQGRAQHVVLRARWTGHGSARIVLREIPPTSFTVRATRFPLFLGPGEQTAISYEALPRERGACAFGSVAVRSRGPLGLLERQILIAARSAVRVYPDLVSLSAREAALVAPSAWRPGVRRGRVQGEGREFHQLRDYVAGDDARLLDWKALAHRGRPTVREYRAERNQRVLLVLDAGRLMTAWVADRLRFDWAVQAAGRLARVALAMGDVVGLALYSREVKASLAPARGPGHLTRLAELLCEARPDLDEPDLAGALHTLLRGNCRRTLVVLFTELADQRAADATLRQIGSLAPRHLGLVVTLADADLDRERRVPPDTVEAAYRRVAAEELWEDTVRTEKALHARGALVVRARADALAGEAVERYVEIKRTGRL